MPAPFCLALLLLAQPDAPAKKGAIGLRLEVQDGRLMITEAIKNGPGHKAGLKAGDQIVKANEVKVKETADGTDQTAVVREITRHEPGEMVVVRVKRGDKERSIEVILGKYATLFPDEKDDPPPPKDE